MRPARTRLILITAWAGSLWTVGYLVAPTLFATLSDRALAGTIAGAMFRTEAWLSAACGVLLLCLYAVGTDVEPARRKAQMLTVAGMLACAAISHLGLQPMMAALREGVAGGAMDTAARSRFGMLHGVSMGLYLIQSVLALLLVLRNGPAPRPKAANGDKASSIGEAATR